MSAILQVIPSVCRLFFPFYFECQKSLDSTRTNPDKAQKPDPVLSCHNYPVNRKQAQHQREWRSQPRWLKWYFKKQHNIITLLLFKCLIIATILKQIRTIFFKTTQKENGVSSLCLLLARNLKIHLKKKRKTNKQTRKQNKTRETFWRHPKKYKWWTIPI